MSPVRCGFPPHRTQSNQRDKPGQSRLFYTVKTKTVPVASLLAFALALEEKRTTAAAAAKASKAVKELAELIGLPAESVLLKSDDKSLEVAAIFNVRPVAAIAEREDRFHSYKVVKG